MANPLRGEVAIPGTSYVLRFTINSICAVEAKGIDLVGMLSGLEAGESKTPISDVRLIFWSGLIDQNPDLTIEQAGEIVQSIGFDQALGLTTGSLAASTGTAEPEAEGDPREKKLKSIG